MRIPLTYAFYKRGVKEKSAHASNPFDILSILELD